MSGVDSIARFVTLRSLRCEAALSAFSDWAVVTPRTGALRFDLVIVAPTMLNVIVPARHDCEGQKPSRLVPMRILAQENRGLGDVNTRMAITITGGASNGFCALHFSCRAPAKAGRRPLAPALSDGRRQDRWATSGWRIARRARRPDRQWMGALSGP